MRDITATTKSFIQAPKFDLGTVLVTSGVIGATTNSTVVNCLWFHADGDWGDLSDGDHQANDAALVSGDDRLFSSYGKHGRTIWVITEADRSVTTVLLPDEY